MKKNVLAFLMLFIVVAAKAQNDSVPRNNFGKNEVKLNAPFLLAGVLEPSYERNLNEESSVGISFFMPIAKDLDIDINYYISPYYRIFFGKKYAAGFFLEGFGMVNSTERTTVEFSNNNNFTTRFKDEDVTDFALGFGVGAKWMTTGGFVFELSGGIGRNLFKNESDDEDSFVDRDYTIVAKAGFNLGYRF